MNENETKKQKTKLENARRSKLQEEKPLAYKKIMNYAKRREEGKSCAIINLAFDYKCNMHCKHCLIRDLEVKDRKLTTGDIHRLALEADSIGLAQWTISGGEPLFFENLDEIIDALMPEKFHIALNTNGLLLTPEKAIHLKEKGVDKIKISLDEYHYSPDKRPWKALQISKEVGLDPVIYYIVTHENIRSEGVKELLDTAFDKGYMVDLLPARALGEWKGRNDLLIDDDDADYLRNLHKEFPAARWDMMPAYEATEKSCGCIDSSLHITPYGDVQPCVYINISLGNIFDDSLQTIIDRGYNIKWFRNFQSKCLSGQDRYFIENYMDKYEDLPLPVDYKKVFKKEDYINPESELC